MPYVIERFSHPDYPNMRSVSSDLGGILFTPSVFINCLISSLSKASLYGEAVLSILGRSSDFLLTGYVLAVDKNIIRDNLNSARVGGFVTPEKFGIIEGALNSLVVLRHSQEIEIEAHQKSSEIALYDARRLEAGLQHNITVLTCEPEHFTLDPDERNHIFRYRYADIVVGRSENLDVTGEDNSEATQAKVWVFTPEALANLLNRFNSHARIGETDRQQILSFVDYEASSNANGSFSRVKVLLRKEIYVGEASCRGPIDAVLRAVESAVGRSIDLEGVQVHHKVSDTTTEADSAIVFIRLNVPSHYAERTRSPINCISAMDESVDTLKATARAYIKALNTLLRELHR